MSIDAISVREYLERLHQEYVSSHEREHVVHADAHAREHALNQQAISKAEDSVDKAVRAARETVGADMKALSDRMTRSEEERRRQLDDMKDAIAKIGLDVAAVRTTTDGNVKGVQAIQDSQTWIVRLVIGVVVLAIIALIVRPGLL